MSISATCPACGMVLNAPDALAGKQCRCPSCGGKVPIIAVVEQDDEQDDDSLAIQPLAGEDGGPAPAGSGGSSRRRKRPVDMAEARKASRRATRGDHRKDDGINRGTKRAKRGTVDRRQARGELREHRKRQREARKETRKPQGPRGKVDRPSRRQLNERVNRPPPAAHVRPSVAGPVDLDRNCPSCRARMVPGAVICIACGHNVVTGERIELILERRPINLKPILAPIVAVALIVGTYVFLKDRIVDSLSRPTRTAEDDEKSRISERNIKHRHDIDQRSGRRTPPPPPPEKKWGEFTFQVPSKGWRKRDQNDLIGPMHIKTNKNARIYLTPYRSFTFAKIHKAAGDRYLGKIRLRNVKAGPLTEAKHAAGPARRFRLDYADDFAPRTRLYILIQRKQMILQVELYATREQLSKVEPDFLKVVESVRFDF